MTEPIQVDPLYASHRDILALGQNCIIQMSKPITKIIQESIWLEHGKGLNKQYFHYQMARNQKEF